MKKKEKFSMRLKLLLILVFCIPVALSGCVSQTPVTPTPAPDNLIIPGATPTPQEVDLNLFAAASLTEAFTEIGEQFQFTHPGVTVLFNFAGSQQLAQQITQGAPADVFASANQQQMQGVVQAGNIAASSPQVFARNSLVVIIPSGINWITSLADLAKPGLKIVLAAAEVPVGQYSLAFLDKASADPAYGAGYKDGVLANVVSYEQNVKAVLAKVALGEADAGIVYLTDISGANAGKVNRLEIPETLNVIAEYPIAPVAGSAFPEVAQALVDYILSPDGQAILQKYHFMPAE